MFRIRRLTVANGSKPAVQRRFIGLLMLSVLAAGCSSEPAGPTAPVSPTIEPAQPAVSPPTSQDPAGAVRPRRPPGRHYSQRRRQCWLCARAPIRHPPAPSWSSLTCVARHFSAGPAARVKPATTARHDLPCRGAFVAWLCLRPHRTSGHQLAQRTISPRSPAAQKAVEQRRRRHPLAKNAVDRRPAPPPAERTKKIFARVDAPCNTREPQPLSWIDAGPR